jgi:hypothetical protein
VNDWVALIALVGSLVLVVTALRSRQLSAKRSLKITLVWVAIFLLVAAFFTAVGPGPAPWRP